MDPKVPEKTGETTLNISLLSKVLPADITDTGNSISMASGFGHVMEEFEV